MMNEKRYYVGNGATICDSSKGGSDFFNMLTQFETVDLLNEQDEFISFVKDLMNRFDLKDLKDLELSVEHADRFKSVI